LEWPQKGAKGARFGIFEVSDCSPLITLKVENVQI